MFSHTGWTRLMFSLVAVVAFQGFAEAQRSALPKDSEFGPVVTAYLGYLSNEQEVVDDRISRREISAAYYRRNSNRIGALRQMALRLVRQSRNDYVPELEAVTGDELGTIFEQPPRLASLRDQEIFANKFRFLGTVQNGEMFYLFARLDPYEQAELIQRGAKVSPVGGAGAHAAGPSVDQSSTRARRVVPR